MYISGFARRALIALAALAAAGHAYAAHDYYVHTEPYNPMGGQQPWSITVDGLGGVPLVAPSDACGMRFEGDWNLQWRSDLNNLVHNIPADGAADVYLPRPGCGAWSGVVVEPEGEPDYAPPYDIAGRIETYANGYWINSAGQKLIYLHQPCHPMPGCIQGPQRFLANSWSDPVRGSIRELHLVLEAIRRTDSSAFAAVNLASAELDSGDRVLAARIGARRELDTGTLEVAIRPLEDFAQRRLVDARSNLETCSASLRLGRRDAAYRACAEALLDTLSARAALDTGDAWVE
jgi:hypothetical protein